MGFAAGTVSFRRYRVTGKAPASVEQATLDKLAEFQIQQSEFGLPDEVEIGWCGGRHIFDAAFTFENNVYADAILFGLRVDTNKPPAEVRTAYQMMEEESAAGGRRGRDAKEAAKARLDEDLRAGKFRRSKLVPMLWDVPGGALWTPAAPTLNDKLVELFERTFELALEAQGAGAAASRLLQHGGRRRDYEDLRPTRFVHGGGGEQARPDYPWTLKGVQSKDFLGNEFLLWLWHEVDAHGGQVKLDAGGDANIVIEQVLDLDCAYGESGRDLLRSAAPAQMPEARDALRSGKVPRKMGLTMESGGVVWRLAWSAESFALSGVKLPQIEEAENPRVVFEERLALLRQLCGACDGLYETFLKLRTSSRWESATSAIRKWIGAAR
jgi:hypothetical protein